MEKLCVLLALAAVLATAIAERPDKGLCIKCCEDKKDGDYQSCHSCHVYVTCSNGNVYDDRPCPADLVWDDKLKRCNYNSSTCPENSTLLFKEKERCITSCKGKKDGDYQSCTSCRVFATCSNGILYDNRTCPANLVWDDDLKRCATTSKTCPESRSLLDILKVKPRCNPCIKSCKDKKDGDYQSCHGCHVYATCSNGIIFDDRPCPADLVWDDKLKRCNYKSDTCTEPEITLTVV